MTSTDKALFIRADANAQMGTGHLMRCLALAQAWQAQGGEAIFITACNSEGLLQRLRNEGCQTVELEKTYPDPDEWDAASQVLAAHPDAWVVLDGYHFDPAYQRRIKVAGHPLLVIDDMAHLDHYDADVILNQNIHAAQLDYSCEPDTRLLLGTDYVLLRREFWPWREWEREIPDVARKVLVTLGGGDPDNQTLKVIRALQQVDVNGLETIVVVGASNPHYEELAFVAQNSGDKIRVVHNVSNMPDLMAWADVAITAGGSTCWEIAFMGLPNLVLILAENQRGIAEGLAKSEIVHNLGWHLNASVSMLSDALQKIAHSHNRRDIMSQRGRMLIDGAGGERVITQLLHKPSFRARLANTNDMRLLFEWANDPLTRQMSFHSKPIPWETHRAWFKRVINDPETWLMIIELREGHQERWHPIGQVRIDSDRTISISLEPAFRGKRLSLPVLQEGIRYFQEKQASEIPLNAYIKPENKASQRIFMQAGFEFLRKTTVADQACLEYVYRSEKKKGNFQ